MPARHATSVAAILLSMLAATGCGRDDAATGASAAATTTATTGADAAADPSRDAATADARDATRDVVQLTDETSPVDAAAAIDPRTLAGTFGNGSQKLVLTADGRYAFAAFSPSARAEVTEAGTWTLAGNGRDLLLDPDAKDDPDRAFELDAVGDLRGDGAPLRRAVED